MPERLGFQAEVEIVAGLRSQTRRASPPFPPDSGGSRLIRMERLVGSRQRGNRSAGLRAGDRREDAEQILGVIHPRPLGPVRLEDPLLHPRAVEAAIGKAVDGEHIGVRFLQPIAERREVVALTATHGPPPPTAAGRSQTARPDSARLVPAAGHARRERGSAASARSPPTFPPGGCWCSRRGGSDWRISRRWVRRLQRRAVTGGESMKSSP